MTTEALEVRRADWFADRSVIEHIRRAVFIEEQKVPVKLEWDGLDTGAVHVLGNLCGQVPAGTGRLLPDGRIGRLAVLPTARGRGLGGAMLEWLVECAGDAGHERVLLAAQIHATVFYERHGFVANGPVFDDAGIPHRLMYRRLS